MEMLVRRQESFTKMVAVKFLGIIVTFYTFIILEAYGQNFYPARYGKRDENDSYQTKGLLKSRRIGRGENQDALSRKIGFFVSGGRFGKRGCSENCYEEGSKEVIGEEYHNRQDRSERIRIPIRKNQFMIGSRFGKRREEQMSPIDFSGNAQNFGCNFVSMSNLFKCLERKNLYTEGEAIDSNPSSEFFQ